METRGKKMLYIFIPDMPMLLVLLQLKKGIREQI